MTTDGNLVQLTQQDPKRLRWRIHYVNGQTVSSREATWQDAPSDQLVAVVWTRGDEPRRVELGTPYYINMGTWINRVWDATLYLRKLGTVKFGRWADPDVFHGAWQEALKQVVSDPKTMSDEGAAKGGIVAGTTVAKPGAHPLTWVLYYDDMSMVVGHDLASWHQAPSDGVMAGVYAHTLSGVTLSVAMRRHTLYFWEGGELVNTDDFDRVIAAHPQFKRGCPSFTGGDYLGQGEAIAAAIADTLEDVP